MRCRGGTRKRLSIGELVPDFMNRATPEFESSEYLAIRYCQVETMNL
jgi:hypothetical protein